jgi:hypothetical protein
VTAEGEGQAGADAVGFFGDFVVVLEIALTVHDEGMLTT